ncbi:MAG: hypothetical protein AAGC43_14205 [Bacteroidota bacterium]
MSKSIKEVKTETDEQKVQKLIGFNYYEKIGLGFLLVLIIIAPVLFTQFSTFYGFNEKTGAIGDTIGGVTAPFVNLLAAYLVYKSFAAQIRANSQQRNDHDEQMKQLQKEHSFNYISNYYNLIKEKYGVDESGFTSASVPIWDVFHSSDGLMKNKNFKILNNPSNFKTEKEKESNVYKEKRSELDNYIKLTNKNINSDLKSIENQLDTLLLFYNESDKSSLETGIKSFYRLEVEKIFLRMELDAFYDDRWNNNIEAVKDYLNIENSYRIKSLRSKTKDMMDKMRGKRY